VITPARAGSAGDGFDHGRVIANQIQLPVSDSEFSTRPMGRGKRTAPCCFANPIPMPIRREIGQQICPLSAQSSR
jgi:hypothetical protein